MSTPLRALAAALALVALLVFAVRWWTDPSRQIERRMDEIEKIIGKSGAEANLQTLTKVRALMELFHEPFEFRAPMFEFATRDRRTLAGAVQQYRSGSERVAMTVTDREIHVDGESRRATSFVVATFSGGLGDFERDAYRFQVNWIERDGEWKIDYVELVEAVPRRTL